MKLEFSHQFFKKTKILNFTKICPVGAESFQANRQMDRHDARNNRSSQFYECT